MNYRNEVLKVTDSELIKKQKIIKQKYKMFERIQTNNSNDKEIYSYCQRQMDRLDEESEQIRIILETGVL